jgi:hypothetical protein
VHQARRATSLKPQKKQFHDPNYLALARFYTVIIVTIRQKKVNLL